MRISQYWYTSIATLNNRRWQSNKWYLCKYRMCQIFWGYNWIFSSKFSLLVLLTLNVITNYSWYPVCCNWVQTHPVTVQSGQSWTQRTLFTTVPQSYRALVANAAAKARQSAAAYEQASHPSPAADSSPDPAGRPSSYSCPTASCSCSSTHIEALCGDLGVLRHRAWGLQCIVYKLLHSDFTAALHVCLGVGYDGLYHQPPNCMPLQTTLCPLLFKEELHLRNLQTVQWDIFCSTGQSATSVF